MSVNSSNSSLPTPPLPSSLNFYHLLLECFNSTAAPFSIFACTITIILFLLPLFILVLYLGYRRWRQQRSGTAMSHSDFFTYHMVIIELMNVLGSILYCCALLTDIPKLILPSVCLFSINLFGQNYFHILTCLERYLAVVHPVTYLGLRNANGIRIRNITTGCVWLLSFVGTGILSIENSRSITILSICFLTSVLMIISFCSLSVLCALIRPGPGEVAGGKQQVHQSKLRAFYTIMAILGVLLLRLLGSVFATAMRTLPQLVENARCGLWFASFWLNLPSSLVLPLLFLHRAGKLPCCKKNTESG